MSGLTDAEVGKQINHMVAFIEKEGLEKAEEIDTKAEEEFNIEKVRLVQTEKKAIMKLTERKTKQAEVDKKIAKSSQLNAARLKILQMQDQHLTDVFAKTSQQLNNVATTPEYANLCEQLLVQGLVALIEDKVEIRCRKGDIGVVKKCFPSAQKSYTEHTGKKVTLTLNEKDYLPDTCCGGVELRVGDSYRMSNTLENRLELAFDKILPAVRNILFGIGTGSRAFFDKEA
eukprot:m.58082 g.58082  ORF g.58082 m.58082 type:complete len:230 (-) comp17184_c0_seq1:84-773(-)